MEECRGKNGQRAHVSIVRRRVAMMQKTVVRPRGRGHGDGRVGAGSVSELAEIKRSLDTCTSQRLLDRSPFAGTNAQVAAEIGRGGPKRKGLGNGCYTAEKEGCARLNGGIWGNIWARSISKVSKAKQVMSCNGFLSPPWLSPENRANKPVFAMIILPHPTLPKM